jgi:tetrahydromethanopterin S-methyltransferase subunit F
MALDIGLDRNVGGIDRLVRAVLAVVGLSVGVWGLTAGQQALGIVGLLAGVAFAFNALTQFCVANALLGVDTCSWEGPEEV